MVSLVGGGDWRGGLTLSLCLPGQGTTFAFGNLWHVVSPDRGFFQSKYDFAVIYMGAWLEMASLSQ